MHFEIKDFNFDHFIKGYQQYFDSYQSSLVLNLYNLEKSKGKLVYFNRKLIASILPNFFGENYAALDFFYLDAVDLFELKDMFSKLDELKKLSQTQNIIIRNVPISNINQISKDFKSFNLKKPAFAFQVYPSENEFPHVVYSFSKTDYSYKKLIEIGEIKLIVFESNKFSEYRYTLNRLAKKFSNTKIECLDKDFFLNTLESWKQNFFNKRNPNFNNKYEFLTKSNFLRFWYEPILQFWSFYELHSSNIKFVSNSMSSDQNLGFWVGSVQNNCLFIMIFLSNRHSSLFSDLLLLDIISFSIKNKFKKIFLGGSETETLYNFKKKYINCFEYSYTQKVIDLNLFWNEC